MQLAIDCAQGYGFKFVNKNRANQYIYAGVFNTWICNKIKVELIAE